MTGPNGEPLPLPPRPTTLQAAQRAWRIAHLHREGAMDRNAALFSLSLLHQQAASPRVQALCVRVAESLAPATVPAVTTDVTTDGANHG